MAHRYVQKHRREPPDLWFTYHLYHKAPDWLGPAISTAFAIPYIVTEASVAPKRSDGPWATGHTAVCDAVRKASRIMVMNPDDAACLIPLLADENRLVGLPPFLDTLAPRQAARARNSYRTALTARHGLRPERLWIAVAAMMRHGDKLESYRLLAQAKRRLQDLPLTWLIAGDGPARVEVETAFGAEDTVFLGALAPGDIDSLHAAADFAVWPAVREAFGMALLEAQAAGLPVIAGATPGVAQIVADGKTGLLTPAGDVSMLANAVRRLVESPALRERMRGAAMKKAEQDHDIGVAAQRIDRVLREASAP